MHRLLISILAFAALAGCADFDNSPDRQGMLFDSEACRFSTESEMPSRAQPNDETAQARANLFDKTYRACMTSKGYDLSAEDPSAKL